MIKQGYLVNVYWGRNNKDKGAPYCVCLNETDAGIEAQNAFREIRDEGYADDAIIWGRSTELIKKMKTIGHIQIEPIDVIL